MKKKTFLLLITILCCILIVFSGLEIIKQINYKKNYNLVTAKVIKLKTKSKTKSYLQYTINNQIINKENNKYEEGKKIEIYYKNNEIYNIKYKKSIIAPIIISIISLIILIYCIIINNNKDKSIKFYKFKKIKQS